LFFTLASTDFQHGSHMQRGVLSFRPLNEVFGDFPLSRGDRWFECSEAGKSPALSNGTGFPSRQLKNSLCSFKKLSNAHGWSFSISKTEKYDDIL
jgi:hypothetical protein